MTKTPRTDAEATLSCDSGLRSAYVVHVEFARELEREIERLRAERNELRRENATLRAEIERYRIQSVQLMDLQRLLEVQDRQLESAQRALQILEGANGGDAKAQGCCGGTRSLSGPLGSRDVG